jgi:hypothetical protein
MTSPPLGEDVDLAFPLTSAEAQTPAPGLGRHATVLKWEHLWLEK